MYLGANNESRGRKSVTGVHGGVLEVLNKSIMGVWKNEQALKCNEGMASGFTAMLCLLLSMGM